MAWDGTKSYNDKTNEKCRKFLDNNTNMPGITRGRSTHDPPCPHAHAPFSQTFPWEASPKAYSEVIFYQNIGCTDKLSRSCLTIKAWLSYGIAWVMGIAVLDLKLFDLWLNWNLWFWAVLRDLSRRHFWCTDKRSPPPLTHTKHPAFKWCRLCLCVVKTVRIQNEKASWTNGRTEKPKSISSWHGDNNSCRRITYMFVLY